MSILKLHKGIDKKKQEETRKLNEDMQDKFVRFQLEHNVRATIVNQFSGQDLIVDMVMNYAKLGWRPMEAKERENIEKELARKAGLIVPK